MSDFAIFETGTQRGAPEIFSLLRYHSLYTGKYWTTFQGPAVQED